MNKVNVTVHSQTPACEASCMFSRECANHTTAGDFRHEDGLVPDLHKADDGNWYCSKNPKCTFEGAILIDGTHSNDIERYV